MVHHQERGTLAGHFLCYFIAKTWELVNKWQHLVIPPARAILKHTFLKPEESKHLQTEGTNICRFKGKKLVCYMKLYHSSKTSVIKLLLMQLGRYKGMFIVAALHTTKNNYINTGNFPRMIIFVSLQFINWKSYTTKTSEHTLWLNCPFSLCPQYLLRKLLCWQRKTATQPWFFFWLIFFRFYKLEILPNMTSSFAQ